MTSTTLLNIPVFVAFENAYVGAVTKPLGAKICVDPLIVIVVDVMSMISVPAALIDIVPVVGLENPVDVEPANE
jgi:predicted Co/Zn/Cd cation transporter (cation efflux family)